MKKQKRSLLKILMALMLLFFYLPIGFMIVFSFNSSKSLTHFTGFSMQWYSKMLADASMMESLYVTIIVAIIATVVSTVPLIILNQLITITIPFYSLMLEGFAFFSLYLVILLLLKEEVTIQLFSLLAKKK